MISWGSKTSECNVPPKTHIPLQNSLLSTPGMPQSDHFQEKFNTPSVNMCFTLRIRNQNSERDILLKKTSFSFGLLNIAAHIEFFLDLAH
jgi:hypothetical protein